jgi:hypothetical protein
MGKAGETMQRLVTTGVRLPGETRQKVAKHATVLSIPQSAFIRVLINLAIEQIEKDPAILLKRYETVALTAKV